MKKNRSFDDEVQRMQKKEKCARTTFTIIELGLLALMIICLFVNWRISVGVFIFFLWSECWYDHGCEKWVTDEYEQGGYPTEGLKTMFISWLYFIWMAGVVYVFLYPDVLNSF